MRLERAAVLVAAFVALACLTDARPNDKTDQKKSATPETYVVPNVLPTGYSVTLDPGVTAANLSSSEKFLCGNVVVNITCRKATDKIVLSLNTKKLKINPVTAKLTSTLTGDLAISGVTPDPSGKLTVELKLPKTLTPDHAYQLRLQFNGTIDALDRNPNGWSALLYIEAGKATNFFPCFDDPVLKVPFDLKVARPKNMNTLSSVGSKSITPMNNRENWVWEEMARTMPVSIQYFTVLISDLKLVNETTVSNKNLTTLEGTQAKPEGVVVRVWGREMFTNALLWASSAAPSIVCSLQCFVGAQFPASRLDIVALPSHHGPPVIGQGLLVYRESGVQNVTAEGAALHIARGAASQFFGLLVTPENPKDERINTALVNYLATEAVRQAIDRDYLPNAVYSLYYELGSQFPLAGVSLAQRQNIEGNKAELVLRMLSITMGEKTMKAARLQLLEEKIFRTYTADQLWELVTTHSRAAGGLPEKLAVKDIINSWMCRNKLPVLEVIRNYEKHTAELRQSVFHRYPDVDSSNSTEKVTNASTPAGDCDEDSPWILPVVALGAGQPFQRTDQPPRLWMTGSYALLDNCSSNDDFLLVNPAETAPYVVNYDTRNWELLAAALNGSIKTANATTIDVLSRAKLVHDALLLGRAGRLRLSTTMTIVRTLEKEEYPSVWRPVGNVLDQLGRDMDGTRLGEKFNTCIEKLLTQALAHVEEVAAKVPTTPTPPPTNNSCNQAPRLHETRALILNQLRRVGRDPCGDQANEAFKVWKETDDPDLGTPLSDALLCCLFRWESMAAWDFGLERMKRFPSHRLPSERDFLLKSLAGCPRTSDKKRKILNFVFLENNGTNFSEADQRLVLKAASSHGHEVLSFLIENWDVLKAKYEKRPPMWESLVVRATSNLKTKNELQMLQKLAEDKKGQWGSSQSLVTSAIARTREALKWSETAFPDLEPWLDQYLASNTTAAKA